MPTVVPLTDLGSNGFTARGQPGDFAGWSVSGAGDFNGDGFDDFIIGAPYADETGNNSGAAYVVYGRAGGFPNYDLANLATAQGVKIIGSLFTGMSVSSAGDVNGDGFDDLIVGARTGNNAWSAFVVFGKASHPTAIDLTNLASSDGFSVGAISEFSYYASNALRLAGAGDVNGDGFDDVIVGAQYALSDTGAVYVVFGKSSGFSPIDLENMAPNQGFAIRQPGIKDSFLGTSVSSAGDLNGDGYDDIVVSDWPNGPKDKPAAFVLYGKASGFSSIDLGNLAANAGFKITSSSSLAGQLLTVSKVGDINGDGLNDIIIGSSGTNSAYVLFGKTTGFTSVDLDNLGTGGFAIHGASGENLAWSMAPAGDVNRDGIDDIFISAGGSGRSYVIFGRTSGFGTVDLSYLWAREGIVIQSPPTTSAGVSVASAGDLNRDGFADLVIGQPYSPGSAPSAGQAYVILSNINNIPLSVHTDFNGDGKSDILWRNDRGQVTDWLASGGGQFVGNTPKLLTQMDKGWHVAGAGDFNGDGRDDILWRHDNGLLIDWLGQLDGTFAGNAAFATKVDVGWQVAGTGDFNGDGRTDILWRHDNGLVTDWLGQSNAAFAGNGTYSASLAPSWRIVGTGDFNGDGRADILWRNSDGTVTDWLGQADGTFAPNAGLSTKVDAGWRVAGTGDFNGDGKDDVLWRNDSGQVTDWLAVNGGLFAGNASLLTPMDYAWHVAQIGDFNGDGRDDVLWRNVNGTVTDWLGQANATFAPVNGLHTLVPTDWQVQDPFL